MPNAIHAYLEAVIAEGASDLHLAPGRVPRVRIDGEVRPLETAPLTDDAVRFLIAEILPAGTVAPWDDGPTADFAYDAAGLGRFRVNAFVEARGVGAVLRAVPRAVPTAEELQLPHAVRNLATLASGLVLVTGAAGQGKSTTLAALVDLVNRERRGHIVTIEDPIEFAHESHGCLVTHREVGRHTPSFPVALADALREDPDVIVVGEIRSVATLQLVLEAAETGHLVLGTLHTISAVKAIGRVVGMVDANRQAQVRLQLAEVLRAVVAQRLLPRIGGGRVAAFEILLNSSAVYQPILTGEMSEIAAVVEGGQEGMQSIESALGALVISGRVTWEHACAHAHDAGALRNRLLAMGYDPDAGAALRI